MELTNKDLEILNTKVGLKKLIANNVIDLEKSLNATLYELELRGLQEQLINLQERVIKNHEKVVVIFEGRDSAGKGGAIRRITSRINPRHFRIIALPKPSFEEEGQWYFQRYVNHLPNPGEMLLVGPTIIGDYFGYSTHFWTSTEFSATYNGMTYFGNYNSFPDPAVTAYSIYTYTAPNVYANAIEKSRLEKVIAFREF